MIGHEIITEEASFELPGPKWKTLMIIKLLLEEFNKFLATRLDTMEILPLATLEDVLLVCVPSFNR